MTNTTTSLELLFSPAEFTALSQKDLHETTCVVFDILRATSSMVTALANGALAIQPVAEIAEALAVREQNPQVILAGERNGLRIPAGLTGGIDFDLGNSPREFTPAKIQGRLIVMSTTNGTRALRACARADHVLIGSFLNLNAVSQWLRQHMPRHLVLVCGGTLDQAALEDVLAAGALSELIWPLYSSGEVADSAEIGRQLYAATHKNLMQAIQHARNGRRLLANPELKDDVAYCLQRDLVDFSVLLQSDGRVTKAVRSQGPGGSLP